MNKTTFTIDRFEGEFAVCELENMTFANLPKEFLPEGAVEGSTLSLELDTDLEQADRTRIKGKMDQLFQD